MLENTVKSIAFLIGTMVLVLSLASSANEASCVAYFSTDKILLENEIQSELRKNPGSLPLLVVSDTMEKHLFTISRRYQDAISKISENSELNSIKYMTSLTEATLKSFYELNFSLSSELKKAKKNEEKIESLSKKVKTCVQHVFQCDADLRTAIDEARTNNQETLQLVEDLKKKAQEFQGLIQSLRDSRQFPDDTTQMLTELLNDQSALLGSSYLNVITSYLENQNMFISLGVAQIPALLQAKVRAAHLEVESSQDLGVLSLKTQRQEPREQQRLAPEQAIEATMAKSSKGFQGKLSQSKLTENGYRVLEKLENGNLNGASVFNYMVEIMTDHFLLKDGQGVSPFSSKDIFEIATFLAKKKVTLQLPEGDSRYGRTFLVVKNDSSKDFAFFEVDPHDGQNLFSMLFALYFFGPKINATEYREYLSMVEKVIQQEAESGSTKIAELKTKTSIFSFSEENAALKAKLKTEKLALKNLNLSLKAVRTASHYKVDALFTKAKNISSPMLRFKSSYKADSNLAEFRIDVGQSE